ncbi:F0F1 ATP synthase subunit delta [Jannaschia sp. W003]|uniref:F0F1 ATP synthase subunit delta n=1 Tax=Jannaschia sp. W003 TaxID=2867012 RepID=UPI0028832B0E|nr:F0F1 ATP synthase subunit delta [Jannaschia sp. W003]
MSEPASVSMGIASRYAQAVFDLSRDADDLGKLEADVAALDEAIRGSSDLREVLRSPVIGRAEQANAVAAVAGALGLGDTMTNTLRLMAQKRRLFVAPALVEALKLRLEDQRGEVTAKVHAAQALSDDQRERLAAALKASTGRDVKLDVTVDESLIGGLVVRMGSKMIDTSIRAKLDALQNTMKEVR